MVRIIKSPEERRTEIIDASCRLFLSKGYDNTTMKDVMEELKIAKGTIYHYFKSKDDLLDAVLEHVVDQEIDKLRRIFEESKGSALERLQQLVLQGASHSGDEHEQLLEHLHQPSNAGMHIRMLAMMVEKEAPIYAELISLGCEEGTFSTDTPLECAEFLLSGIQFLIDLGIYPWSTEQLARRWQAIPGMLESLLQAPEGSFSFLYELSSTITTQPTTPDQSS